MGGYFGVASKEDCSLDLFFGVDYHSHLGTRRGGIAVVTPDGHFSRSIHNIQNSPFRTKFENDMDDLRGKMGIGCISDFEPQPLLVHSHLGNFAITTVGIVTNKDELVEEVLNSGYTHFLEMSGGEINQTELIVALMNHKKTIVDGIKYVQQKNQGFYFHADFDSRLVFMLPATSLAELHSRLVKKTEPTVFLLKTLLT